MFLLDAEFLFVSFTKGIQQILPFHLIYWGIYFIVISKTITLCSKLCTPLAVMETSCSKVLKPKMTTDISAYKYKVKPVKKQSWSFVLCSRTLVCCSYVEVVRRTSHGAKLEALQEAKWRKSSLCGKSLIIVITVGDIFLPPGFLSASTISCRKVPEGNSYNTRT